MEQVPTPPQPGGMTVSPLFEWETVAVVVALVAVVALLVAVALVAGIGRGSRRDWEAWLASRAPHGEDRP
ncbi:hypothetical protein [Blastococcus sp. TF02A-35]|uniref:hypothetical protein n=1 Tax=Blastococcus sp. TF02A-35 TaxID=2559612 RepID=UPI00107478F1|nr:hypothetical protein [Blastococcus sp. TF02A_35]TFV48446.1 hypothetical protein E4P43_13650 [Blastococcus sp. TF02A_35]